MRKIENPDDFDYNYQNNRNNSTHKIRDEPKFNDESSTNSEKSENGSEIDEYGDYKVVDEKAKTKLVLCIVAVLVVALVLFLVNSAVTKTQKSEVVTDVITTSDVSEVTDTGTVTDEESTATGETTKKEKTTTARTPADYTVYGSWKIDDANIVLQLNQKDSTFKFTAKQGEDTVNYYGECEIYNGETACVASSKNTMDEIYDLYHIEKKNFNANNLYYVRCNATKFQKNNEPMVTIDTSKDLEEGGPIFEHLLYIYQNSDGKTVAKYYDDTSTLKLFTMTYIG